MEDEKSISTLTLASSPGAALMQPLPLALVEDTLTPRKREVIQYIANNPSATNGWIAEQVGMEVNEIKDLMLQPRAREYMRSYMATVVEDEHTTDDLLRLALRQMMQLGQVKPQDYLEVDIEGNFIYSLDKLKKAPPGAVVQLDIARGRLKPTFVDSMKAREAVVAYHTQLVAGKRGNGGNGGIGMSVENMQVNLLADADVRKSLRDSFRMDLAKMDQGEVEEGVAG